ncbi:type II toxin-antitoxin system RelE/ParE family toxin [Streptomyces wuyuanensis]|uniref:type II toxin-antitoxin system RelE/ParE family toxin n=1 Tax=Streptomyces wuyuanensis TaxID=1196353 RepID=UPI003414CDB0
MQVNQAFWVPACKGPAEGRPLMDRIRGSVLHNLKELRPGSAGRTEVRILFMLDPWRSSLLLVAGNRSGDATPGTPGRSLRQNACARSTPPPARRSWNGDQTDQVVGEWAP